MKESLDSKVCLQKQNQGQKNDQKQDYKKQVKELTMEVSQITNTYKKERKEKLIHEI